MEIEELPDLGENIEEYYEYHGVPLLDYVCEVANRFLPNLQQEHMTESKAPAIFSNRYVESKLSMEERYQRHKEFYISNETMEDYLKRDYRELDDSFKEKFLTNEDLQNTIEAFGLDVSKFWYLLLFVYDYIEDIGKNAPTVGKTVLEDINDLTTKLSEATSITLKKDNRKSYATENENTINFINAASQYYVKAYNSIINADSTREDKLQRLKEIGLDGFINGYTSFDLKGGYLDISYKKWKFTEMFQFFLEDKKASKSKVLDKRAKVSTDKWMFISRLIYTVGYDGKRYNEEYDEDGNKNRMLSNLLRRYSKEEFPTVIGHYYMR